MTVWNIVACWVCDGRGIVTSYSAIGSDRVRFCQQCEGSGHVFVREGNRSTPFPRLKGVSASASGEQLARKLGQLSGLEGEDLAELVLLSRLYDVGKLALPEEVLSKPGQLDEMEWRQVRRHPSMGYYIVRSNLRLESVATGVLSHHEHWDGSGYPHGLKGEEIPLQSRITALVDAYEAITQQRPYREPLTREEALAEIDRCSGTQFDPRLVSFFRRLLENQGS